MKIIRYIDKESIVKKKPSRFARIIAAIYTFLGFYLLLSLFFSLFKETLLPDYQHILLLPGSFLIRVFSLVAFYIPLFLFAGSVILIIRPFNHRHLITLLLTIIPFITFTLFLGVISPDKVHGNQLSRFININFGEMPGGILLFSLFISELFLIYAYVRRDINQSNQIHFKRSREKAAVVKQTYPFENSEETSTKALKRQVILDLHRNKKKGKDDNTADESKKTEETSLTTGPGQKIDAPEYIREGKKIRLFLPVVEESSHTGETIEELEAINFNESEDPLFIPDAAEGEYHRAEEDIPAMVEDREDREGDNNTHTSEKKQKKFNKPYRIPVNGLLKEYKDSTYRAIDDETRHAGQILMETLREFKITAEVTGIRRGPVITMFEILPAPGVKLSKIVNLADNIALRLAASRVRIVAPIPGKHAVGIEVPNKKRGIVSFKELISLKQFYAKKYKIPVVVGKDIAGEAKIIDLSQTPHLLIAGATGSGKSVCVNSIICSLLYRHAPDEVKLLLIDPKIIELKFYNDIPHLLTPVITNARRAFQALQYCICEMEHRYSLLDSLGVRDIESFNNKIIKKKLTVSRLPYIVIIIDEFADFIATTGKEMEATIARLAAMSRAVGIHFVLATQRPSVEVITGLIKANFPSRIAFMVASKFDSRIIIDSIGAEKLLGKGDMLLTTAWNPIPIRIQGTYLSEEEVESISAYVKTLGEPDYIDEEIFIEDEDDESIQVGASDPLMEKALEVVIAKGKASASFLQRRLKIGYNRAARLIEEMEMRGIVGPQNGSKPRDLLHIPEK
jgi:S-DNA-T family DNA segregation ATPase FtsK/SpoIIIE